MQISLLQVRLLHRPSSSAAPSCFIVSRIKRAILTADAGRNWDWLSWQRLVGSNESFTWSRNTILFKKITIHNWAAVILNFNGESNMEASGTLNYDFQKLHTESFNYSLWVLSQSMCHHDIDITIKIYIHIRLQGYEMQPMKWDIIPNQTSLFRLRCGASWLVHRSGGWFSLSSHRNEIILGESLFMDLGDFKNMRWWARRALR